VKKGHGRPLPASLLLEFDISSVNGMEMEVGSLKKKVTDRARLRRSEDGSGEVLSAGRVHPPLRLGILWAAVAVRGAGRGAGSTEKLVGSRQGSLEEKRGEPSGGNSDEFPQVSLRGPGLPAMRTMYSLLV